MQEHRQLENEQQRVEAFMGVFIPRTDWTAVQLPEGGYVQLREALTRNRVYQHLRGEVTLGAYALDPQSQAKWVCIDADTDVQFVALQDVMKKLEDEGQGAYLEQSRRGGHLWLFLPRLVDGRDVRRFAQQLLVGYGYARLTEKTSRIEIYPKQDRLLQGAGSLVRLPLGIHRKTNERYHFVSPAGDRLGGSVGDYVGMLSDPRRLTANFFDGVLALAPEPKSLSPTPNFEGGRLAKADKLSDALKGTISVYDFVRQVMDVDEQGRGYCPFHQDEHQSFQVNIQGNYWNCYAGCGGGSIIDFWMKWREAHDQDGSFTATILEMREMLI